MNMHEMVLVERCEEVFKSSMADPNSHIAFCLLTDRVIRALGDEPRKPFVLCLEKVVAFLDSLSRRESNNKRSKVQRASHTRSQTWANCLASYQQNLSVVQILIGP